MAPSLIDPGNDPAAEPPGEFLSEGYPTLSRIVASSPNVPDDDPPADPQLTPLREARRTLSLVERAMERLRGKSPRDDVPSPGAIDDSPIEPRNPVPQEPVGEGGAARTLNDPASGDIRPVAASPLSAFGGSGMPRSPRESLEPARSAAADRPVEHAAEPRNREDVQSPGNDYTRRTPIAPLTTHRKESQMSRLENLTRILKNLQSESPGVEACALISEDGLIIASVMPPDMDDTRVGGMTATLLNLGTRAAVELRRGDVHEVIVRGGDGYAVMVSAGRGVLMLVLANENTKLGLIFFDMREAIKNVNKIL